VETRAVTREWGRFATEIFDPNCPVKKIETKPLREGAVKCVSNTASLIIILGCEANLGVTFLFRAIAALGI